MKQTGGVLKSIQDLHRSNQEVTGNLAMLKLHAEKQPLLAEDIWMEVDPDTRKHLDFKSYNFKCLT